jgi:hypothetical protein
LLINKQHLCIHFSDQCCSPSYSNGVPNWYTCRLYYQLHPPSSCSGYRAPAIGKLTWFLTSSDFKYNTNDCFVVTGVGDPHVNTIDNGRYTCHIQGLYIFAQTNSVAKTRAENNLNRNASDSNLIYPDDLFQIQVRSVYVAPALSYIERTQGYGSIFSSYTIITDSFTFFISNNNGKFGKNILDQK